MPRDLVRRGLPSGLVARVVVTDSRDGDLAPQADSAALETRQAGVAPMPWTWLRQVHGSGVVEVGWPGDRHGATADAAVTNRVGCTLSVTVADCAPVAILADGGGLAVVHAGWRGILGGVIESAMDLLSDVTVGPFRAVIGPCINACCYAFGVDDLERVVAHLGDGAGGKTRTGHPALDLPAAVIATLRGVGVVESEVDGTCTSCDDDYWSYRSTGTRERHAMAAWLEPA